MWQAIKQYYTILGQKYHVDPVIFVGIHIIATPLFLAAVAWIVYNHKKSKSIFLPALTAALVFNAANIYLVIAGRNVPFWIYLIIATTTIMSGYFSIRKIQKKLHDSGN